MSRSTQSSRPLSEIRSAKKSLRAKKRDELAALDEKYIISCDEAIASKLLALPQFKTAATVFAYYSVGREVSTVKIISDLLSNGRSVALPVSGSGGLMSFYKISSLSDIKPGRFGIPEPGANGPAMLPKKGDLVIVPALCCDRAGNRLGHGAGYYDRFLADCEAFSVCLCRKRLLEERLPVEDTDKRVSLVLTD